MRLNVEIATKRQYYEDRLRRKMKNAINEAILVVLASEEGELNSLKFSVPTTRKRRAI